jgi:hypothetical protein
MRFYDATCGGTAVLSTDRGKVADRSENTLSNEKIKSLDITSWYTCALNAILWCTVIACKWLSRCTSASARAPNVTRFQGIPYEHGHYDGIFQANTNAVTVHKCGWRTESICLILGFTPPLTEMSIRDRNKNIFPCKASSVREAVSNTAICEQSV